MVSFGPSRKKPSLKKRMLAIIFCSFLFFSALTIVSMNFSRQVVREEVASSNQNMLNLYMDQIDTKLKDANNYLFNVVMSDNNFKMDRQYDSNNRSLAKNRLFNKLNSDISFYPWMSSIFVYYYDQDYYMETPDGTILYDEAQNKKSAIINLLLLEGQGNGICQTGYWIPIKVSEQFYLVCVYCYDGNYIGATVKVQNLSSPMELLDFGKDGFSFFFNDDLIPMNHKDIVDSKGIELAQNNSQFRLTGYHQDFIVVDRTSSTGLFSLAAVIPDNLIFNHFFSTQRMSILLSLLVLLVLPISYVFLKRHIFNPIDSIMKVIRKVRIGDIEYRMNSDLITEEFSLLSDSFNKMLDQIHELKINVYEEQLSRQQSELDLLQIQLKPHFYLNSLNVIYNLALTKNYELIQKMSMCLVKYFRYMFKSGLHTVPLLDEMKHAMNYLSIQEMRFPGALNVNIEMADAIGHLQIPPLIIYTFIENTVKYAVTLDAAILLNISIELQNNNDESGWLHISITDNGKGFPEEVLNELNHGQAGIDDNGEHVGIQNVQRRLKLMYSNTASILFYNNSSSGASIDIKIPVNQDLNEGK